MERPPQVRSPTPEDSTPIRRAASSNAEYVLIAFDAAGRERNESDGTTASGIAIKLLSDSANPITDVFLMAHGWQGDVRTAIEQYDKWVGVMAAMTVDLERASRLRAGFSPLIVGLHWPSLPWGNEEIPTGIGRSISDVLLAPLRQLSFWKMKDRARRFGETGGHALLADLQTAAQASTRFHLMGHSFGCIVACGAVAGAVADAVTGADYDAVTRTLPRPVDSLFLVQGALSLWSFAADIPYGRGTPGYFHRIVRDGQVRGPVITTRSRHDRAVGRFYPGAAALTGQLGLREVGFPKYGGIGSFGLQGLPELTTDQPIQSEKASYVFESGRIYNVEASEIIRRSDGVAGAHTDIAHPEIAHLLWEAAIPPAGGPPRR